MPHKKISIIEVSAPGGQFQFALREQALADDTAPSRRTDGSFIACHDIQSFLKKEIALGSCAGESQLWDISNRWSPTIERERQPHAHLPAVGATRGSSSSCTRPSSAGTARSFATMDETGGGVDGALLRRQPDSRTASTTSTTW